MKGRSDADHQNEAGEEEREEEDDEEEEEDEQQLLGEFEKELEGILLPADRERLRSEVKAGMERELENIIQEVRAAPRACAAPHACAAGCCWGWPRGPNGTKHSVQRAVYVTKGGTVGKGDQRGG